jgi:hypothetical protein
MRSRSVLAPGLVVLMAACSSAPADTPPPAPKAPAGLQTVAPPRVTSGPRFVADGLPLLPDSILYAQNPPEVIRASYKFAAEHPEVLNYVPCFCGCERGGHKGSHDCFIAKRDAGGKVTAWDSHGITCDICLDVAYTAMQMHNGGASVSAIRTAIDKKYLSDGHSHGRTPTPMPPKSGTGSPQ